MKTTHWIFTALTICSVALAGCKKAGEEPGPIPVYYGVKMVDLPKLDTDFANASQDVQSSVSSVKRLLRYAQFPQAVAELGKLANNPNLSEPQKQVVNGLIEQTKQAIANSKAPPAQ